MTRGILACFASGALFGVGLAVSSMTDRHVVLGFLDVFGDFAHAWSTYESRRKQDDEKPFMRGINSIQLVRIQGRWWVANIMWEQEHDAGPIPAQYLPAK